MTSSIQPSVGRKVWVWGGKVMQLSVLDAKQPFDATIIYVHPNGSVNLKVSDHEGNEMTVGNVQLVDPSSKDRHDPDDGEVYATWMPFQVDQAKAAGAVKTAAAPTPTATPKPTLAPTPAPSPSPAPPKGA